MRNSCATTQPIGGSEQSDGYDVGAVGQMICIWIDVSRVCIPDEREGKKRGAVAVGIASDERQRHGFNPHKRARLVLAGADVLVPDFSWQDELVAALGWAW